MGDDRLAFELVDKEDAALEAVRNLRRIASERHAAGETLMVAVSIEGDLAVGGNLSLVHVKTVGHPIYIFDVLDDPAAILHDSGLGDFLQNPHVCKVMHACRENASALYSQHGIRLDNVFDTQIAHMLTTDSVERVSLDTILETYIVTHVGSTPAEHDHAARVDGGWDVRPLTNCVLRSTALGTEDLCDACVTMCRSLALDRVQVVDQAESTIETSLEGLIIGTPPTRDLSNYENFHPQLKVKYTARAFFRECLEHTTERRERCQDAAVCKVEFLKWRQVALVPGCSRGTRYRGSFGSVRMMLLFKGLAQFKRHGDDPNIIVWSMDSSGRGAKATATARLSASTTIRKNREYFEQDKSGVSVGLASFPETVATGQPQLCKITVVNTGKTSRSLNAVRFLQSAASGRSGVFETTASLARFPMPLIPTVEVEIDIICTPMFGVNRDILEFDFGDFSIGRFLEVQAGDAELADMLKPTRPYQKRKRKNRRDGSQAPASTGTRPGGGGKKWDRDCGDHSIPKTVATRFRSGELEVELAELHERMVKNPVGAPDNFHADYPKFYHSLVWVEEMQLRADLSEFDMDGIKLTTAGRNFRLAVPGLAENRPSVLRGDKLVVRLHGQDRPHHGFAVAIERDSVHISLGRAFADSFLPRRPYDVEFTLNRTLLRIQHGVLDLVDRVGQAVLYPMPNPSLREPRPEIPPRLTPYKREINPEQSAAVRHILEGRVRPMPYIVFGPPGTGKTKTVVEAIAQAVKVFPKTFRILACAPSNTAADVLCLGLADHVPPSRMIRVVAASRYKDQVHKDIHPFCLATDDESEAHFKMPEHIAQLADKRVTVTTLSMASKLPFMLDLPRGFFDLIVIDEAGQAPEPEAVAVIAHLLDPTDGQIVLAGDPKQLGPIIHSNLGKRLGLDMSLLERLTNRTVYLKSSTGNNGSGGDDGDAAEAAGVGASAGTYNPLVLTKLVRNYRSHVDILELPSRLFYDGELIAAADKDYTSSLAQWEDLPAKGVPLIFHGVEGKDTREANSPSWFNVAEIEVVRDYVKLLLSTRRNPVKASEIGIIAPYQKQVRKIKALLGNRAMIDVPGKDLGEIMVGSAEQFQGQEKRVIILSTVRSSQEFLEFDARHSLGFLTNAKRFNVAITRPMCLLIVIGHPGVLSGCPNWRALIEHCHRKGACRGVLPPPSQMGAVGAGAVGASAARSELDESLVRMQRRPEVDEDDDGSDHAPSQHIMQTSIGFVREE